MTGIARRDRLPVRFRRPAEPAGSGRRRPRPRHGRHAVPGDRAGAGKPGSAKRDAFRARLRTDRTHLFGLLSDGVLTAKIAARYPLAEAAQAMELAESSGRTAPGKIILVP